MRIIRLFVSISLIVLVLELSFGVVLAQGDLRGELYSVIGVNRECSTYSDKTLSEITYNEEFDLTNLIQEECSNGFGLVNTYDREWNPYKEYKDGVFQCPYEDGCILEVYCCGYGDCVEDSDCRENVGLFSKCEKTECKEWKNEGYKCEVGSSTEKNIPYQYSELNYCTKDYTNLTRTLVIITIAILVIAVLVSRKKLFGK